MAYIKRKFRLTCCVFLAVLVVAGMMVGFLLTPVTLLWVAAWNALRSIFVKAGGQIQRL